MKFENLTPEQLANAKACKTPEDYLALAKEEGYELTNEELESISGGLSWDDVGGVARVGAHKGTRGAG